MSARAILDSPGLYTIGWIAALPIERASATALLDERHDEPHGFSQHPSDTNSYTWGRMGKHNIVIASLAAGVYGTTSAATTASNLLSSLPEIRIGLLVGIGGGIARPEAGYDIRLGDVVVSQPDGSTGGVVQYDLVKAKSGGVLERKDFLNMPPAVLLNALSNLQAEHCIAEPQIPELLEAMWKSNPKMKKSSKTNPGFLHQGFENDRLFKSAYVHIDGRDCRGCDNSEEIEREGRESVNPEIHYGIIASGNTLIKNAATRDRIIEHVGEGCLCVEMEAAGLMNHFPCLIIRGICDYADSHKNDAWQCYASATAAAFGKELLQYVPVRGLQDVQRAIDILPSIHENVKAIHKISSNTNATVQDVLQTLRRDEDIKILNWLSSLKSQEKHRDILTQYQEGTGSYLLNSQYFREWLDGKNRILWCIGSPGTGKTVLASIVIDTIEKSIAAAQQKKAGLAFLYCAYAERNFQTIDQLIGSLIRQLLQTVETPKSLSKLYKSYKESNTPPSIIELREELCSTIKLFSKVYIIVDALDECDDTNKTRSSLLSHLLGLSSNVQIFFTSRPLEAMEGVLRDAIHFRVTAQEGDMRMYIGTRVKEETHLANLCAANPGLEDEILDRIIAKVDGMFLLAKLHVQSIASKLRVGTLRNALRTLPERLNDTYDEAIERIRKGQERDRSELAMRMLKLLSFALRPLKLDEVQHALLAMESMEFETSETEIDYNDLYDKKLLFAVCAGIVTLEEETSIVRFVHHTAEKYFEFKRQDFFPDAQTDLAKTCLTCLSFPGSPTGWHEVRFWLAYDRFYRYAAQNWGHHARDTPTLAREIISILDCPRKVEALSQALMAKESFWGFEIWKTPLNMTSLHIAALFGLDYVVERLMVYQENPDLKDRYGRTPLWHAARHGNETVVEMLLKTSKVDFDVRSRGTSNGNWRRRTYLASEILFSMENVDQDSEGSEDLGDLEELRSSDLPGETPLSLASRRGDEAIVQLLLRKGANPNLKNGDGRTPLSLAAHHGRENVVKLLVGANCEIDARDAFQGNHLDRPYSHPEEISEAVLIDLQILIRSGDIRHGWTALQWATVMGHIGIVKFLIDNGSNIPEDTRWGVSTLSLAVTRSHSEIVRVLVAAGANVGVEIGFRGGVMGWILRLEQENWTVLHIAAARRDASTMQVLLENGANIAAEDVRKLTPLHMAAMGVEKCGMYDTLGEFRRPAMGKARDSVKVLHQYGANIEAKNEDGESVLFSAARYGETDIVEYLLELGAASNVVNRAGFTPLHVAVQKGYLAVVKVLIHKGEANVNAISKGCRLLHVALGEGYLDVVELLIREGANIDAQSTEGISPLFLAALLGKIEAVKLLLHHGANLELSDKKGRTALHAAAAAANQEIFDLLVNNGAKVDVKDDDNNTPQSLWGNKEIIEYLEFIE
ncbi:hypothetical protein TWF730_010960 [Orbilia blumenaviensis]|uniref:Nephrocystin 3-like N-terminal domain-containing protein n=1 Tax=Orbilia blumenaviensis TaxID=1796055 RepID=A0AAV9UJV6_9PEZI